MNKLNLSKFTTDELGIIKISIDKIFNDLLFQISEKLRNREREDVLNGINSFFWSTFHDYTDE